MKLDKFQQFVKDGEISADLDPTQAKNLIQEIDENKRTDLMELIELSLDMAEIVSNAVYSVSCDGHFNDVIKSCVNEAIEEALEEIEDIEDENKAEPQEIDCCDADKLHRELNQ